MLVNARLRYISVDGKHYSLYDQVILAVYPLTSLHFWTDSESHLATETEQDRTRLSLLQ